jgi:leucyl aminopeptidase
MRWSVVKGDPLQLAGDLLVVPVPEIEGRRFLEPLAALLGGRSSPHFAAVKASGFKGAADTAMPLYLRRAKTGWLLLVGLGKPDAVGLADLRSAAGLAAQRAAAMDAARVLLLPPGPEAGGFDPRTIARCWVEGTEMSQPAATPLKQGDTAARARPTGSYKLIGDDDASARALRAGVAEGRAYAAGCLLARRLVDLPPNHLTPRLLATEARKLARSESLTCRVLGPAELRRRRMGGILGVAQGSSEPPRLIVLEWSGPRRGRARKGARRESRPLIALVGKGVTFDAGGISLKPPARMDLMKSDMAGAAAVLGATLTACRLGLPARLLTLVPAAENLPDGKAIKPADVLKMASGRTVEVLNTDAEGRLLLADALTYAGQRNPDYVIDAATLTGSCAMALGKHFAGLMGNDGDLLDALQQAGGETFERVWHLPLIDAHRKAMEGSVSDYKNLGGGREAGMSTAAGFLSFFVPDELPWAHLDIAGVAWADSAGVIQPKGATGFGARLLARAIQILAS